MKKFLLILLAYFLVYLGFLFVQIQYYWILENNVFSSFTPEKLKEPIIPSLLSTSLAILFSKIKK